MTMPENATRQIKQAALALGFDQVGVTRSIAFEEAEVQLERWIQEGRHGAMEYLKLYRERKQKFFENFPDARSVLVLGVNYFTHDPARPDKLGLGRVARYARGLDYHTVIRQKHARLLESMQAMNLGVFRAESCVDTKPLPERYAAMQAGLGFFGKNTMLLSRQFGPWLYLSEIVTNLDLEEDRMAEGHCGTCDHCQTACPTGALDQDYRMDARRCIAYLTIEYKGVIPREMRPYIKDWIFGCDECLTVCPFTSKERETTWSELKPEAGKGAWLDMDLLFGVRSNREYEELFRGTALLRANRKQMWRNACIVLGNTANPAALPYLKRAADDPAPLVRQHAAWALGRIPGPEARRMLEAWGGQEADTAVQEEIRHALQETASAI